MLKNGNVFSWFYSYLNSKSVKKEKGFKLLNTFSVNHEKVSAENKHN